jgi:hypothetical protein
MLGLLIFMGQNCIKSQAENEEVPNWGSTAGRHNLESIILLPTKVCGAPNLSGVKPVFRGDKMTSYGKFVFKGINFTKKKSSIASQCGFRWRWREATMWRSPCSEI